MSGQRGLPLQYTQMEHEPRTLQQTAGPPPAYRSGVHTETDTWSQYSDFSTGLGKRRASWTNLVESEENLNKHKVNCYPKVAAPFNNQSLGALSVQHLPSSSSRSSSMSSHTLAGFSTGVYQHYMQKGSYPVQAEAAPVPAGAIPHFQHRNISKAPSEAPSQAQKAAPTPVAPPKVKRNRMQEMRQCCSRPRSIICWFLLLLIIGIGIILAIVLTQVFALPKTLTMNWQAPDALRGGQTVSNRIQMTVDDQQVRFALTGAMPFKGNYVNYYDFKTNRVAVVDESLRGNGKNLTCFILPLDRSNIQSETDLRKAAAESKDKKQQTTGWEESWNYIPSPLANTGQTLFNPPIKECIGSRWVQLDYVATNQKGRKCSDCFDFCLPEYGIVSDNLRGTKYLNIVKQDCFYLFVPEWRSYAQANTMEQNQKDFESYYRNRNHLNPLSSSGNGNGESKWISLQGIPQNIMNTANRTATSVMGTIGQAVEGVRTAFGGQNNNNNNNNYNQQPQPYGNGMNQSPYQQQSSGYGSTSNNGYNGVNGVVNLNGINGNSGTNMYNTGNTNPIQPNSAYQPDSVRTNHPNGLSGMQHGSSVNMGLPSTNINNNNNQGFGGYVNNGNTQGGYGTQQQQQQNMMGQTNRNGYSPDIVASGLNPQPNGQTPLNTYNSAGFSMPQGENSRNYPDINGPNPQSGYIPQVQTIPQGVVGMETNSQLSSNHPSGYTPDIQPSGRWIQMRN